MLINYDYDGVSVKFGIWQASLRALPSRFAVKMAADVKKISVFPSFSQLFSAKLKNRNVPEAFLPLIAR